MGGFGRPSHHGARRLMAFCFYCTRTLNDRRVMRRKDRNRGLDFTVDHKIPLCRGGADDRANKVPCCHRCNNLKGDMTSAEFFHYIARFGYTQQPQIVKDRMKHETQYARL
jgi:5-methylcytosine-specific restriction endonuclease McrA